MPPVLGYFIHAAGLGAGLLILRAMERRQCALGWLVAGTLAMAVSMGVWLFHVSAPSVNFADFAQAYYPAGQRVSIDPQALTSSLQRKTAGFVNLPILAYLFVPLAALPLSIAGWVFFSLGLIAVVATWWMLAESVQLTRFARAGLFFLFAANGPLIYSLKEGNTTHIVLLFVVYALRLLEQRKDRAAGIALAIAALIKPPLLLFGGYFALRRQWKPVIAALLVCVAAIVLSVVTFGVDMHLYWYQNTLQPYGSNPLSAFNVQSLPAFFARLTRASGALGDWSVRELAPGARWASRISVLAVLLVSVLILRRGTGRAAHAERWATGLAFAVVLLLAVICFPLSWSHYLLWGLVPIAYWVRRSEDHAFLRTGWGWASALAVIMISAPAIEVSGMRDSFMEIYAKTGASCLLFGALLTLAFVLREISQATARGGPR
jgi:hypothetical protein